MKLSSSITSSMKTVKNVITANSPTLLVGTAIAGIAATGVLAARAGWNAHEIVIEKEQELQRETTVQEKVQLTWLCYAVPAVTGTSAIAACFGAHVIHTKRTAAMAGMYAVAATKLDDMQEKAEELLGAKKSQQFNNELAQRSIDRDDFDNSEVVLTGDGTELMKDDFSGRWFRSSVAKIESAMNEVNRRLINDGEVPINDYWEIIGLDNLEIGTTFGWTRADKPEARFGSALTKDQTPVVVSWFHPKAQDVTTRRRNA